MKKVYLVQEIPTDRQTGQPKYELTRCYQNMAKLRSMFPKIKTNAFFTRSINYRNKKY